MTAAGSASSAISNGLRYISWSARASTTESEYMRNVSVLLAAKCLTHAPTPVDCTPDTNALPSVPDRYGSSEKYSKFLPQSGERFILSPGASRRFTPTAVASAPIAAPTSYSRAGSQLLASMDGEGKSVAGNAAAPPSVILSPHGPSEVRTRGSSAAPNVCHISSPVSMRSFSSSVSAPSVFSTSNLSASIFDIIT